MLREASHPLVHRMTPRSIYLMQMLGIRHWGGSGSRESRLSEPPALCLTLQRCKMVSDKSLQPRLLGLLDNMINVSLADRGLEIIQEQYRKTHMTLIISVIFVIFILILKTRLCNVYSLRRF